MRRGDVVLVAMPGDFGKPRPALVVQNDIFNDDHATITLVLITSELHDEAPVRLAIDPSPGNGLRVRSQIMIDKLVTHPRHKLGRTIGRVDDATMQQVDVALALWLDLPGSGQGDL